jgi:predicted ferric reductase
MKQRPLTLILFGMTLLFGVVTVIQSGWPADFWQWRRQLVLLSGVLLMTSMSLAMLLAVRPGLVERPLGGLDKMYQLHKSLGIAAGILLAAHWLIELSPPLAFSLHWVEPMARRAHGHGGFSLVRAAHQVGEWCAWAMLAMVPVALLRLVPYRWWRKSHTLFAPLYLLGAFHSVVLMPGALWLTPVGLLTAALLLTGSVCAMLVLTGQVARKRRHGGEVVSAETLPGGELEVRCRMGADWPGHRAGQFARVTFDAAEGAHPFTIVSGERERDTLRFIIKPLGDYTRGLAQRIQLGQQVDIEGPYGRFQPERLGRPQTWVAAGIGVAPFIAWLQTLADQGRSLAQVDFFYCVKHADQAVELPRIREACARTGVRLHLIESGAGQRLSPDMLPPESEVWFCGPLRMQRMLTQAPGIHRLHAEAFAMR